MTNIPATISGMPESRPDWAGTSFSAEKKSTLRPQMAASSNVPMPMRSRSKRSITTITQLIRMAAVP